MTDESAQEIKQPAARPAPLTEHDRRRLAALLEELVAIARELRSGVSSHAAEDAEQACEPARPTSAASHGR